MAFAERPGRGAVVQPRRLGPEADALQVQLEAGVQRVAVEDLQAECVQGGEEGHVGMLAERLAECQRAMRGQLGHQSVGNRTHALVLLRLGRDLGRRLHRIGVALDPRRHDRRLVAVRARHRLRFRFRLDRQLILRPDVTALDAQTASRVDADEGARPGDLVRLEHRRPILQGGQRRLDLAKPPVRLLAQLLGVGVLGLDAVVLAAKRVARGRLLFGQGRGLAPELAQPEGVAVGEVGSDLDPLSSPQLGPPRLRAPAGPRPAGPPGPRPAASRRRRPGTGRAGSRRRRLRRLPVRRTGLAYPKPGRRPRSACGGWRRAPWSRRPSAARTPAPGARGRPRR